MMAETMRVTLAESTCQRFQSVAQTRERSYAPIIGIADMTS